MKMRALFQALGPEMSVCSRITAWLSASPRSTQHWTEGGSKIELSKFNHGFAEFNVLTLAAEYSLLVGSQATTGS